MLVNRLRENDEQKVRGAVLGFAQSMRARDYDAVCESLITNDLVERLRLVGDCLTIMRRATRAAALDRGFQVEVVSVEVEGKRATARLRTSLGGRVATSQVRLAKERDGRWRVAGFQ